jgi:hypothetical protein
MLKYTLLLLTTIAFAQDGYWDNQRITSKEIKLAAGQRTIIKSEEFPDGTTEFAYRVTLLDENQKMTTDLTSVLKAIPDPYFIGKGAGGAIDLATAISGTDKCTYAIFSTNNLASDYVKTSNFKAACLYQNNPISKEAKVVALAKSTCLVNNSKIVWFGFESKNWILGQKIILEIVPWINNKANKIWNNANKKSAISFIKSTEIASKLTNSDAFCYNIIEKLQNEYKFDVFNNLSKTEKTAIIQKLENLALIETKNVGNYNLAIRQEAKILFKQYKYEEAIYLVNDKIINKKTTSVLDLNLLGELYLYSNQFDKALKVLKEAETLDSSELLVQLNIAHANMFMDNMSDCREIHNRYKLQNVSAKQTWKNKTINDIDKFQKANLTSDNFKKILRLVD